jgi:glycosyltransferase involved in cell wall biosynthesis
MSTATFALLVFTLNEIDGMKQIMPRIQREWVDEILVVDGGSTDGTVEFARENGYPVYVQKRMGFRHAYIEALDVIKSDYVIAFSPDGNSLADKIPELKAKALEGYDMVTCSRYLEGAKSYDDDLITAFGNRFFTRSINLFHGGTYTDAMVMYRAVHRKVFAELRLDTDQPFRIPEWLFQTRICLMPLLSIRAARKKLRTTEIPGDEPERIGGERKLKIVKWGMAYYFQVIFEMIYRFERRE